MTLHKERVIKFKAFVDFGKYVLNLNRGGYMNTGTGLHEKKEFLDDPQYYIDISVTPIMTRDTYDKATAAGK